MKVQIENGPAFEVTAGEDSLLRGALRAGFDFPYECSVGGCGGCRFDLLDGPMATLWEQAPGLSERDRRRGKRLACQSRPEGDCTIRVRPAGSEPSGLPAAQRLRATLLSRRAVTPDLSEFTFRLPVDGTFRAGQYALLYPPGVEGARAYSFSDAPGDPASAGLWRFMIRRVPGGRGSNALFDRVAPGDAIDIDGPYGHAWLRPGAADAPRDVVCIAGGSGLGPMLSVARGVLAESGTRRVHFFLGLRTQAELGAAAEVASLENSGRLQLTTVLSNPTEGTAWSGATGFVHSQVEAALTALGQPFDAYDHYFAGPPPMVEAVQDLLMLRQRVPFGQIHFDRFV
ncbi:MAG: 2Fe-2S iron-sulfur cluster binding domain-containing protein [Burkholderiaceae bacterium]|nr:2Fe-2S iron-sulfur cluster binding domain-containing protein [Burkholderiaceae bacterium]